MHTLRRITIIAIAAGALLIGSASAVAAHPQGHAGGCQTFGHFYADWARGGYAEAGFPNPGFAPFARDEFGMGFYTEVEHEALCGNGVH